MIPLKLASANLQVTCAPASCSLDPQNSSQLYDDHSLINQTANGQDYYAMWIFKLFWGLSEEMHCMIEHGADIKSQIKHVVTKSDLAIAQLLQYNCFAKNKEDAFTHIHSKNRETPFAVYVGLSVFAKTRKRHLVDVMHKNGLSISYDRV